MRIAYVLMLCLCFAAAVGTAGAATPRIVGGQAALAADWGVVAAFETTVSYAIRCIASQSKVRRATT